MAVSKIGDKERKIEIVCTWSWYDIIAKICTNVLRTVICTSCAFRNNVSSNLFIVKCLLLTTAGFTLLNFWFSLTNLIVGKYSLRNKSWPRFYALSPKNVDQVEDPPPVVVEDEAYWLDVRLFLPMISFVATLKGAISLSLDIFQLKCLFFTTFKSYHFRLCKTTSRLFLHS